MAWHCYFYRLLTSLLDVNIFWQFKLLAQLNKWVSVNKKCCLDVHLTAIHYQCFPLNVGDAFIVYSIYYIDISVVKYMLRRKKYIFLQNYEELTLAGRSIFTLLHNVQSATQLFDTCPLILLHKWDNCDLSHKRKTMEQNVQTDIVASWSETRAAVILAILWGLWPNPIMSIGLETIFHHWGSAWFQTTCLLLAMHKNTRWCSYFCSRHICLHLEDPA